MDQFSSKDHTDSSRFNMRRPLSKGLRSTLYHHNLMGVSLLLTTLTSCLNPPAVPAPMKGGTVYQQKQLGPILGPVTKEKVLDRLVGYPVCGIEVEEQKLTLKIRVIPLQKDQTQGQTKLDPTLTEGLDRTSLVEIECFFFGVQGLYEFALITPQDGRLYPLSFEGAAPISNSLSLNEQERRSAVVKNIGRSEVCGVPNFDADQRTIKSFCKADPAGGCGAYAEYILADHKGVAEAPRSLEASKAYFKLQSAHFKSCEEPEQSPPETWPKVSLP